MILDANLLVYAVDERSPHHAEAAPWFSQALDGHRRVGLPWQSLGAFMRIMTHPRITTRPLSAADASGHVRRWLEVPSTWIPPATERTAAVMTELVERHRVTANLVPDAMLAALAIEHGVSVQSADSDFARFPEVEWVNPLLPGATA